MRANQARAVGSTHNLSQAFWATNQEVVDRAVRIVVRRKRLDQAESGDLRSEVWLKLLSSPSAITQFRGDSCLTTYVVSIARRVLLDLRIKELGKWRPTAQSRAGGRTAIELDRLVRRDGVPKAEAIETLRRRGYGIEPDGLESINLTAPRQIVRVAPEFFDALPSTLSMPETLMQQKTDQLTATAAIVALSQALTRLSAEDRALLQRRFVKGETVAAIAGGDIKRQKRLYRQLETILQTLRRCIERAGVSGDRVKGLLVGDLTNVECGCGFQNSPPRAVYPS
jgi:RNA polymerase sigma factor (sigma-70 family)